MVSPGTHLLKNHESQFKKKKNESKIENVGTLFNQTVYLKTDSKTLYYNYILKLKYSLSIFKYSMG